MRSGACLVMLTYIMAFYKMNSNAVNVVVRGDESLDLGWPTGHR